MNKVCKKCGVPLNEENSYSRGVRKGLENKCRKCSNEVKWARQKKSVGGPYLYKKAKTQRFDSYKESLVCHDCNLAFKGQPWLCDFHHTDPDSKIDPRGISYMVRGGSWEKLMKEVAKCIPLCANCHRTRHHDTEHKAIFIQGGASSNKT